MRTNDAQMLVLCALTDGPLHGYAINAAIEQVSGHRLGPGSLYGALARLEAQQLVKPLEAKGRQRPFCLSALWQRESLFDEQGLLRVWGMIATG